MTDLPITLMCIPSSVSLLGFADELGFLSINENLQAAGGPPNIFAVGDVATSTVYPRPKAGVFAVRQGPPLTDNIRRYELY